ncbi:MAG: repressor LexA [Proteobacteria bacterium]|nr:MAG: repressor LexA [Pseudomonadota bacterium]
MCVEASLLHHADKQSADLFYVAEAHKNAERAAQNERVIKQGKLESGFGNASGRFVFVGDKGLQKPFAPVQETPAILVPTVATISDVLPRRSSLPIRQLMGAVGEIDTLSDKRIPVDICRLPLIGQIAAGVPLLDSSNVEGDYILHGEPLGINASDYYLLRVQGDSMIEEDINDGDLIAVRHQNQAEMGDIVVAFVDDGATVKRLGRHDGQIALLPANPEYSPILVHKPSDLAIQGRVVAIVRS